MNKTKKNFSSKKSLFKIRSESGTYNQLINATEKVLKLSEPCGYHSKNESNALEWISKAFDLERFNPEVESHQNKSTSMSSQTDSLNYQINKFNTFLFLRYHLNFNV